MSSNPNLVIHGASGRLGQHCVKLAQQDRRFALVATIVSPASSALGGSVTGAQLRYQCEWPSMADVVLDVSLPSAFDSVLAQCTKRHLPLVTGVTGLSEQQRQALHQLASKVAVLHTANFSRGMAILTYLVRESARLAGNDFDIGITDIHHRHKQDAPSGTALALERAINQVSSTQVQHSALRLGEIVGEHSVFLVNAHERIELTHRALDRSMFASGALDAAAWLIGKPPGLYTMSDVLGLINT